MFSMDSFSSVVGKLSTKDISFLRSKSARPVESLMARYIRPDHLSASLGIRVQAWMLAFRMNKIILVPFLTLQLLTTVARKDYIGICDQLQSQGSESLNPLVVAK